MADCTNVTWIITREMEFNLSDHHLAKYDTVISTYAYQYVVAPGTSAS